MREPGENIGRHGREGGAGRDRRAGAPTGWDGRARAAREGGRGGKHTMRNDPYVRVLDRVLQRDNVLHHRLVRKLVQTGRAEIHRAVKNQEDGAPSVRCCLWGTSHPERPAATVSPEDTGLHPTLVPPSPAQGTRAQSTPRVHNRDVRRRRGRPRARCRAWPAPPWPAWR